MDFEDLMCMSNDEVEYGICCITELFGMNVRPDTAERHKAAIREDMTEEFNGCFPYFESEDEVPCYLNGCDYGCKHCPMKDCEANYEYNPKSDKIEDMVVALIKAIKVDQDYTPTENEISKAIEIIFD